MGKINWGRVIGGGLVAGLVGNVLQALNGFLMKAQAEQMMKSIHKDMAEPKALVAHLVWSFVLGIAAIWLYAAIRPRYGPGPATALRAAFAVWIFAHATFAIRDRDAGHLPGAAHGHRGGGSPPRENHLDPRRSRNLQGVVRERAPGSVQSLVHAKSLQMGSYTDDRKCLHLA